MYNKLTKSSGTRRSFTYVVNKIRLAREMMHHITTKKRDNWDFS